MKKIIWILLLFTIIFLSNILNFYKEKPNSSTITVLLDGVDVKKIPEKDSGYFFTGLNCQDQTHSVWNNDTWFLEIDSINSNLKCTITFSEKKKNTLLKDEILKKETIDEINKKIPPDFTKIANSEEGLFPYPDDFGTSYYFRGNEKNNNVFFAGFYWSIIRINGDNSIRLIYNGEKPNSQGFHRGIGMVSYNASDFDNAYVGFMFGTPKSTDYVSTHQNIHHSIVKNFLDNWYERNLKPFEKNLADTIFCNDRKTSVGYGNMESTYEAYERVMTLKNPRLSCSQKQDQFTVHNTTGNKNLTYPIGLITADEAMLAGLTRGTPNLDSYLYQKDDVPFVTMSPGSFFYSKDALIGNASIWVLDSSFNNCSVSDLRLIRPVINLSPNTKIIFGDGTNNNPYRVEE